MHGTEQERQHWQMLGDGYAIEWPDLDEHIGVEGLLAGRRSGESATSMRSGWRLVNNESFPCPKFHDFWEL
jgi:hypothetical protein